MVTSISKDGTTKELIYQNSVLAVDKTDDLAFHVESDILKWTFKFSFSDEGKEFTTTYITEKENRITTFTLHNWYSDFWIEVSNPIIFELENNQGTFFIKFRTTANKTKPYRQFDITIWKKI